MENYNATCSICGKKYHKCVSCKDQLALNPWKVHTDTPEHFKIYQIIHGYSTGVYNKREAKSRLNRVNLSDINEFRDNIRKIINDIIGDAENKLNYAVESQPNVVKEQVVVEPIAEEKQEFADKARKQFKFSRNDAE